MVGRDVSLTVAKGVADPGSVGLRLEGLVVADDRGQPAVDGVDLTIHDGEIVALAGVQGNGQEELVEAVMGLRAPSAGSISLRGRPLDGCTPRQVLDRGVGFVPEDRQHDGLVGPMTVAENLVLDRTRSTDFAVGPALRLGEVRRNADQLVQEFDIRPPQRRHAGRLPVRREPAEGGAGPRDVAPARAADRLAAHSRRRRRRPGVHPQPHRRRARPGHTRARRVDRARGDPRPWPTGSS